jgi:uncharacterized protein with PIN domain
MNEANFSFQGDLEWFLDRMLRGGPVHLTFEDHQSVKHLIESVGVPHVEVGSVRANEKEVPFSYRPRNGDHLVIFPPSPGCPVDPRFILDNHLGRLTAFLRMLGFDCLYHNDFEDNEMASLLEQDTRILLSRDRQLLMRKAVQYGYCLRSLKPKEQLQEVVGRFTLRPLACPFTRCLRCNSCLEPVEKAQVFDRLEPRTKLYYNVFSRCPNCNQIYWQGSHWERMQAMIDMLG